MQWDKDGIARSSAPDPIPDATKLSRCLITPSSFVQKDSVDLFEDPQRKRKPLLQKMQSALKRRLFAYIHVK
jgi:ribosomal protein S10